jgi:membrane-associated phospholipid phosphatase
VNGAAIDGSWFADIAGFAQHIDWLRPFMTAYTNLGYLILGALCVIAWWLARRRDDRTGIAAVAWTGIGTVLAVAVGLVCKQLVEEPRPCHALPQVHIIATCPAPGDYAFPSDHTLVAVAVATGLWFASRRLGILAGILALLEGFSRLYLGEHYLHDVIGALVIGTLVMANGWVLIRHHLATVLTWLERTPVRALLTSTTAAPPRRADPYSLGSHPER